MLDPSIALEAGKPTNPLGANNQQPNYLANPGALNALMQMAGQKAASDAFKESVGPDGVIDPTAFVQSIAKSPQSAYAFKAMNEMLDATGKQLAQQNTRYEKGASLIAPLLLDPDFNQNNADYAAKQLRDTLTKGVQDGIIDNKTAIYFGGNLPTLKGSPSTIDVNATKKELTRAFVSILPPAELKNAISGQPINVPLGGATQPVIVNQVTGTFTPVGKPVPHAAGPGEMAQPIPAEPNARGQAQSQPLGAKMPGGGTTPGFEAPPNAPRTTGFNVATQIDDNLKKSPEERTKWWDGLNAQQKQQVRAELARRAQPSR